MKNTLTTILCLLMAVALAAGAVCIGARRGWAQEREETLSAFLTGEGSVAADERAMDAANLAVVAARHLPADDPRLTSLQELRQVLQSRTASAEEKTQADASLTALAAQLAAELPMLESVRNSARDQVYIATLTSTLTQGRDAMAFAVSAQDFNRRLASSLTGRLAILLGVEPIDVY
ncbi:MAG: hypothetical protein IJ507_05470 [Clostridia bacterium]|nr:hypothetical protein [Clostridia bacterium]